jgi:hypothetical protein
LNQSIFHIFIIRHFSKIIKINLANLEKSLDNLSYLDDNLNMKDYRRLAVKMTDREKGLLGLFRKLESEKTQDDVIFQAEAMVRAQEALKADYGIMGQDMPLFNGTGAVPGPAA